MRKITKSANAPFNREDLWIDMSVTPRVLKIFDAGSWITLNSQDAAFEAIVETLKSTITQLKTNTDNITNLTTEVGKKANTTDLSNHTNNGDIHVPAGGTIGQLLMSNGDGSTSWANAELVDLLSYGVEWDTTVSSPDLDRIGNPLLHKSLPIQNSLRGCLTTGSTINYYLNSEDWAYKEDGVTASILDGSEGTVRVDTGIKFYGKSEAEGNKRRVRISTILIDSTWTEIPRVVIDAFKCTVDQTDSTNLKAVSVVNTTANFRGGNNNSNNDSYLETNPYRTELGKPRTNIPRGTFRTYAENADSQLLSYEQYKWILYWLPVIEYATFNMQQAFVAEPDANGYKQGGLGPGVTTMDSTNWNLFNGYYPLTPNGYSNSLGNHTGVVSYTIPETVSTYGGTTIPETTLQVARWRGFENIFGDTWTNLDGIILQNDVETDDGNGTYLYKNVYVCDDPTKFADTITEDYYLLTQELNTEGFIGEFTLGNKAEIVPILMNGGATTRKCDCHYAGTKTDTSLRTLRVGGDAYSGSGAGLGYFISVHSVGAAIAYIGFRTSCVIN